MVNNGYKAFSLAEVLITLGIIGVVAAITIPVLIANHRKHTVETKLAKFYSTMNQAVRRSEVENGIQTSQWVFPEVDGFDGNKSFFETYFVKYLKNIIKTDRVLIKNTSYVYTIYFTDGSAVWLNYKAHDWYYCTIAKYVEDTWDYNGKYCFRFGFYPAYDGIGFAKNNYYNKGIEPFIKASYKNSEGDSFQATQENLYDIKAYAKIIQQNGWKIPKDYPIKF